MRRILSFLAVALGISLGGFFWLELRQRAYPDLLDIYGWRIYFTFSALTVTLLGGSALAISNPRRAALWFLCMIPLPAAGILRTSHLTQGSLFAVLYCTVPLVVLGVFWWTLHRRNLASPN